VIQISNELFDRIVRAVGCGRGYCDASPYESADADLQEFDDLLRELESVNPSKDVT
jgi:hypothetical protein